MQVFVVASRNRNLPLPEMAEELHEVQDKEARMGIETLQKTNQFKYFPLFSIKNLLHAFNELSSLAIFN